MMRIKYLLFVFLCFSASGSIAQVIKGKVVSDGQPLAMANVMIFGADSTRPAVFMTTDSSGDFRAELPKPGTYAVKINLIGFKGYEKIIELGTETKDLGSVSLGLLNNTLKEVTVTGRKKLIQRTNTGFIVQTDAIITQAAGTATDLLSTVPMVLVDPDGGITIRGKAPQVLINGRNTNLAANLERIPASSIDRIEVINNPGAKYDADGEGGIINIVLKKNVSAGTNGAFSVAGGKGAMGRFNSSLLLNRKVGNLNLGMSYDNRFAKRTRDVSTKRETYALDEGHYLDQSRHDDRDEQTQNVKLNADYGNKKHELNFEGIFGYEQVHNFEPLYTRSYSKDGSFDYGNLRNTDERPIERNWEGSLNYARKYTKPGKQFSALLSYAYGNEEENTNLDTRSITAKGDPYGPVYLQATRNKELTNITTGRLDWAFPLRNGAVIETGYKGILRHVNADYTNSYEQNGEYIPNPLYSNVFDFNEQIHAVYGTLKGDFGSEKRWKYELGLRLDKWNNRGHSSQGDSTFTNSYFNYFPNANLGYKLNDGSRLKAAIGRRVNRPGLGQLNPFIDITDSLNPHGGNPALQPELINTAEMGWSKDWKPITLTTNIFYRRGTNTIMPYITLLPGGVALSRPQNIGSTTTYGVEAFINTTVGKVWNSTASFSLYEQKVRGEVNGDDISNDVLTWYAKWTNNFNLWKNTKAQVLFNYQAPTAIPQGKRVALYNVDLGFQQKIMQGRARIGLTAVDIFNTLKNGSQVYTPDFQIIRSSKSDTRAVLLTFAMTFGSAFKEKLMENKFSPE